MATASDNFNRANETPLAGNWTCFVGTFNLVSNACAASSPASADSDAIWNAFTPANDQFSQANLTVSGTNGGDQGIGFVLRSTGAASPTEYRIVVDHAATNNVSIHRFNAGVFTGLKQVTQAWTDGDTWRVEISGFVITVKRNGATVTTFDDSASGSKIASGKVGIGYSSAETSASLDNWTGGDLGPSTTLFPTALTRPKISTWGSTQTRVLSPVRGSVNTTRTDGTVASLVAGANPQGTGSVASWGNGAALTLTAAGGVEGIGVGVALLWITDPIDAVTISGSITANLRALETSLSANYTLGCKLYKISGNAATAGIAQGSATTELTTSDAAKSITLTPTSTDFAKGDQLGLLIYYAGIGTSASGFSATASYNGPTAAAAGDTFITLTENLVFLAPWRGQVLSQAVQRAASRCWAHRPSGIVVPKLWTPEGATI